MNSSEFETADDRASYVSFALDKDYKMPFQYELIDDTGVRYFFPSSISLDDMPKFVQKGHGTFRSDQVLQVFGHHLTKATVAFTLDEYRGKRPVGALAMSVAAVRTTSCTIVLL